MSKAFSYASFDAVSNLNAISISKAYCKYNEIVYIDGKPEENRTPGTGIHRRAKDKASTVHQNYCRLDAPDVMATKEVNGKTVEYPIETLQLGEFEDSPRGFVFAAVVRELTGYLIRPPGFEPLLTPNELFSFTRQYIQLALTQIHYCIVSKRNRYIKLAIAHYKRPALKTGVLKLINDFDDPKRVKNAWLEILNTVVPIEPKGTMEYTSKFSLMINAPIVATTGKHTLVGAHGSLRPEQHDRPGPRTFLFVWDINIDNNLVSVLAIDEASARVHALARYPVLGSMPVFYNSPKRIIGEGPLPLSPSFIQQFNKNV